MVSQASLFSGGKTGPGPRRGGRYVRVVVERGIERGRDDQGLTYWSQDQAIAPGDRVEVPLGRADARAGGFVVAVGGAELAQGIDPARVKAVLHRTGSPLTPELVELARWMAGYYVCPLGMVLSALVPSAVKRGVGRKEQARLEPAPPAPAVLEDLPPKLQDAWAKVAAIPPAEFPLRPRDLADRIGAPTLREVNALVRLAMLRPVKVELVTSRLAVPGLAGEATVGPGVSGLTPTPDQTRAIEGIGSSMGSFAVHLLRGVTGSGKTEVYLRLIERLAQRATPPGTDPPGAIVLVPEIALTPQTVQRFASRCGGLGVAVLHSGLTEAQRHAEWARVASGAARVVVGARSAVFAPMRRVGLLIVDEEHDGGYKQDQLPRYHGRDVAVKRAQLAGCPVVLGSATPSLESWGNATGQGARYRLWELRERVGGGRLPRVRVVDLVQEKRTLGEGEKMGAIGPTLRHELDRTLASGLQAILLLNRRGYAHAIHCVSPRCGWVLSCERCSAAMVFHREPRVPRGGLVVCHHCRAEQIMPQACPSCAGKLRSLGSGTQRVEEELVGLFGARHGLEAGRSLLRIDGDTMERGSDFFDALASFGRGESRVLLGTQMIAKGLDFPGVRLVGVINADTGLSLPDFRAGERTFQLISQVAGRAGRASVEGVVVVQTFSPHNEAIVLASRHDYTAFARRELELRSRAGLPPSWRMARVVCRDTDADKARGRAERLARELAQAAQEGVRVTGPSPCALEKIHDHWRFAVEVTAPLAGQVQRCLQAVREAGLLTSDLHTAVDVDPVALL